MDTRRRRRHNTVQQATPEIKTEKTQIVTHKTEWVKTGFTLDLPRNILELLVRRRRQMLVHSCIYYRLSTSIISDVQWQAWASELAEYTQASSFGTFIGFYDGYFADWDGSTGYHLPVDSDILRVATGLIKYNKGSKI